MNEDPPPASTDPSPTPRPSSGNGPPWWFAWLCLLAGVCICCVATGVIPAPEESFRAPWPVIFLAGMFFVCLGFFCFNPHDMLAMGYLVAGAFGCLGTVALWCAVYGDGANFEFWALRLDRPDGVENGISRPFHPWAIRLSNSETLVSLARIFFGVGGAVCFLVAGGLLFKAFRKR